MPRAAAPLVEAAVETLAAAMLAEASGAGRIELAADLARGGVTPAAGLIRAVRRATGIPLQVLIRPRPGDFHYSPQELEVIRWDIAAARDAGAHGVVLGALTVLGEVDQAVVADLVREAAPLPVTFHRAVDAVPDPVGAVATLAGLGVSRVLTSGGAASVEQGIPALAAMVRAADGRIGVLAGGGVRPHNVAALVAATGVAEVHVGFPWGAEPERIRSVVAALGHG